MPRSRVLFPAIAEEREARKPQDSAPASAEQRQRSAEHVAWITGGPEGDRAELAVRVCFSTGFMNNAVAQHATAVLSGGLNYDDRDLSFVTPDGTVLGRASAQGRVEGGRGG
jgi:hypothetical protein